jgi:tetratricopeptide (TPR) repeat protein
MTRYSSFLVLAASLSLAGAAGAQTKAATPSSDADVLQARQRFARGVELYKEGSFDAALAEFNKAYEIAPNYRVLYNLAQVQRERHDYVAALRMFTQYLDQGGAEITAERKDQVTKEIAALKGRVAELLVHANVEGAELWIDGVSAGVLPIGEQLLVSAGVRQLEVRKAGYLTSTRSITIAGGETTKIEFELTQQPSNEGPAALPMNTRHDVEPEPLAPIPQHHSKAPMWVSLVATGLFTGGAVTFGVLTKKADSKLDDQLNRLPASQSALDGARSDLKRDALLTDGLAAAAIVSGGFFLYFALTNSSNDSSRTTGGTTVKVGAAGKGIRVFGEF